MNDHRIRLDDYELDLIVSALRARRAMVKNPGKRGNLESLILRLADRQPGNPSWRSLASAQLRDVASSTL